MVNAQQIKAAPRRKADQKDRACIADLLQHGLLRGSFVPPRAHPRTPRPHAVSGEFGAEINRMANRIQKVLEDANIKLVSVSTDALGASARAILEAMLARGQDSRRPAALCKGAEQDPGTQIGVGRPYARASLISASTAVRSSARRGIETERARARDRATHAPFPR